MDYKEKLKNLSKDELGKIYCKMSCFEWCDIFGDPPEGYEKMTGNEIHNNPKYSEAFEAVLNMLTPKERSMYWWTIKLKRTRKNWDEWWHDTLI